MIKIKLKIQGLAESELHSQQVNGVVNLLEATREDLESCQTRCLLLERALEEETREGAHTQEALVAHQRRLQVKAT